MRLTPFIILAFLATSCQESQQKDGTDKTKMEESGAPMSFEDYTAWIAQQIDEGNYDDAINALDDAIKYYPEESKAAHFDELIEQVQDFKRKSNKIKAKKEESN